MVSRKNQARDRHNGAKSTPPEGYSREAHQPESEAAASSRLSDSSFNPSEREDESGYLPAIAQLVDRHPLATLVAGFSVGFGLGILATAVFAPRERTWWERYELPDSLHDVTSGLRHIPSRIAHHLPSMPTIR